jgi:hypothetical protein
VFTKRNTTVRGTISLLDIDGWRDMWHATNISRAELWWCAQLIVKKLIV